MANPDRGAAGGLEEPSRRGLGAVEHLDFATICNFAKANHRVRAPLARTPALSVNLAMSDQLPLLVRVGMSRHRAEFISPDTTDLSLLR